MKKRNLLKRVAALAMSAMMVLGMTATTSAATPIDDTQDVSLTIVKQSSVENEQGIHAPIEGVEFSYAKIGELVQADVSTTVGDVTTVKNIMGYSITDVALETQLRTEGELSELGSDKSGTKYYDGGDIQVALNTVYGKESEPNTTTLLTKMTKTDVSGTTTTGPLDATAQGLYLVVETSAPVGVKEFCAPFIISLPFLDVDADSDTHDKWLYDVTAYPKNVLEGEPTGDKEVVDNAGNVIQDPSSMVGQTVYFKITSEVPSGDGTLEKYIIKDTMSKGLGYTANSVKVMGTPVAGGEDADITSNFTVSTEAVMEGEPAAATGATLLTITATNPDQSLKNVYSDVTITYNATVNADALTIDMVTNEAGLDYRNDDAIDVNFTETPVEIDIYGYMLTKTGEDGATGLGGAEFKLYSDVDCVQEVDIYDENGQAYANKTVVSDTNGIVKFYLPSVNNPATYYLKETKAPVGYTALKDAIEITITNNTKLTSQRTIINTQGFDLPETGGMGTVIFTIGGIVLMLGAAVLLVRSNKKSKAN